MDVELKSVLDAIRGGVQAYEPRLAALQNQADAIDIRLQAGGLGGGGTQQKSLLTHLSENEAFSRLLSDKRGKAVIRFEGADAGMLQRKSTITSAGVGAGTSGVLPVGRLDGITSEARQQLTIRDLLTATPTTFQVIDFVRVLTPMTIASPAPEASLKAENAASFTTVSERVKTIATWIPATRQLLDDMAGLASFISNSLTFYLDLAEELQLLSGDGTGENIHGLIPQATAFQVGLLSGTQGWNKIDIIGRAIQQITAAKELQPTLIVLHPNDWWDIRLTKDGFGRYILGDPQQLSLMMNIFGLTVLPTTNIAQGTFLVGSGSPVATEIFDRLETIIEVSTEHADFFTKNLVAVRAEKRLALITRRPGSYVTGSFTTSPA